MKCFVFISLVFVTIEGGTWSTRMFNNFDGALTTRRVKSSVNSSSNCLALSIEVPKYLLQPKVKECLNELNINKSAMHDMFGEKFSIQNYDRDTVKFVKCQIRKNDYFNDNEELDREYIINEIMEAFGTVQKDENNNEMVQLSATIFDKCNNFKSKDKVAVIIYTQNCVVKVFDEQGLNANYSFKE
ncbi:hypothetical protein RI129_009703 [Pyrocoelia pectoralis]|uniref:Uncharacterized protein n=1 Tax=Pyrocoelia pectoralis TaxID=417401 RepID=A0AAN7V8Z8_9COLE